MPVQRLLPIISLAVLLVIPVFISGQSKSIIDKVEQSSFNEGKIKIIQDPTIARVLSRNQWENSKEKGIEGYRLRIFSNSGPNAKREFELTKARFAELFDNEKLYPVFDYPFYKIYVGDFRTRSEALCLLKKVEKYFPDDPFIVQTKINYPNLNTE